MSKKKDIKEEIQTLLEKESDHNILEAIRTLLKKENPDPLLRKKLTKRALKSEKDIVEGRLMDRSEFEMKLNQKLGI